MNEKRFIEIGGREVGSGRPVYIIAEMSANHNQDFEKAVKIIEAARDAGADAVKLQTYTPDTITIDARNEYFKIRGTIWEGKNLYDLYADAYTPWEWQPKLKGIAEELGIDLFSTPFDSTAVDFLERMQVPAYKIASFEVVDIPLLQKIARTGRPIIMSTGMASLEEIDEAVSTIREAGGAQLALLKCTSAYPALPEEANLRTIPHLANTFDVPAGLSDHTLGIAVSVAAVALGASIIEKHFILAREDRGTDSSFSMEPDEFRMMVEAIRTVEKSLGEASYEITEGQKVSRNFRKSLFVVKDMKVGEKITEENVRSIRPGYGLHARHLNEMIGRCVVRDIQRGAPLSWDMVDENINQRGE